MILAPDRSDVVIAAQAVLQLSATVQPGRKQSPARRVLEAKLFEDPRRSREWLAEDSDDWVDIRKSFRVAPHPIRTRPFGGLRLHASIALEPCTAAFLLVDLLLLLKPTVPYRSQEL